MHLVGHERLPRPLVNRSFQTAKLGGMMVKAWIARGRSLAGVNSVKSTATLGTSGLHQTACAPSRGFAMSDKPLPAAPATGLAQLMRLLLAQQGNAHMLDPLRSRRLR